MQDFHLSKSEGEALRRQLHATHDARVYRRTDLPHERWARHYCVS